MIQIIDIDQNRIICHKVSLPFPPSVYRGT